MCSTAVPQDNYGMKQEIALYIYSQQCAERENRNYMKGERSWN